MGYLGTKPSSGFITTAKQRVSSSTNNYVDLDNAISSLSDVIVWVNSVKQDSTNLTLTTSTRITLGGTLTASDVVEIAYLGKAVATQTPDTGTVTNDMLAGSITAGKLSSTAVDNTNTNSTLITAQTEKSSLADADKFLISDSAASGALKYVQKSNLPSGTLIQTGRTVISGGNPSGIDVNSCFSSTYDSYLVVVDRIESTVDSQTLFFRLRDSGGSVTASNYRFSNAYFEDDGNTERQTAAASSRFEITNDTDDSSNNGGLQGLLYVHRPADANTMTRMNMHYSFYNNTANDLKIAISTSTYENPEAHTGIGLNITSGGIRDGGSLTVYGIKYS